MRRDLDVFAGARTQRVGRLRFEQQGRRELVSMDDCRAIRSLPQ
jgi:hypothetical protein